MSKPRVIAFYLPQYYPTKENDEWWGKGFTEWTNVGRAKPLFRGHYQPRVPADLGYYDLRLPQVRQEQAKLAEMAGIDGFCYWHYWFAGKRLLDNVFREVVESGNPDFPFCLCWANHSWKAKTWDPQIPDRMLMEQTYPGVEDFEKHFFEMLPAFKDNRYMKVDGKPIFGIYAPFDIKNIDLFFSTWNNLAKKNGLNGFYFFGFTFETQRKDEIKAMGFDSVVVDYVNEVYKQRPSIVRDFISRLKRKFLNKPYVVQYSDYVEFFLNNYKVDNFSHPCINPNFDHSPRSAHKGVILHDSTPEKWQYLLERVRNLLEKKTEEDNLLFIKAWNEWGEGNYLEPDMKFGDQYLKATSKALKKS